jgi:uncharacterized membrane protein HdeD (DUF308 family)
MAQRKKIKKPAKAGESASQRSAGSLELGSRNVIMLVAGIVIITLGYFLLGHGSITAAPLLLVVGYCVVVPLSIILWVKRPGTGNQRGTGE